MDYQTQTYNLRPHYLDEQLKMWNKDKILRVAELLYETEKNCKTTGMPTEEIVGMTILQLSGAARK